MRRAWPIVLTLAGCGRLGFDVTAAGTDGGDATVDVAADLAALACEVDHAMLDMLPFSDQIRVAYSAGVPHVIDIHHLTDTLHEINVYRLTQRGDTLIATSLGAVYSLPDIAGLAVETTASEHVLVLSDPVLVKTHVVRLDANFVVGGDGIAADFALGHPPYARSSAGRMLVGTSSSTLQVIPLDASFSPAGPLVALTGPADSASIAPAGADFIVSWSGAGVCGFVRVDAAANVIAGPITVDPGTTCTRPQAATLGTGLSAYVVHDVTGPNTPTAFGGTIDGAFAFATSPTNLGTSPSFASELVVESDRARVALSDNGTVRIVELAASGVSQVGASIGSVARDALWIEKIGGASILFRIEDKRLVVRKLCR